MKVQTANGVTYSLKAYSFWAKVIDSSNHIVWHSSYFGGIVLYCLFFGMTTFIISSLMFATNYKKAEGKQRQGTVPCPDKRRQGTVPCRNNPNPDLEY